MNSDKKIATPPGHIFVIFLSAELEINLNPSQMLTWATFKAGECLDFPLILLPMAPGTHPFLK